MSKLDSLASAPEASRELTKISFDFSGAHLAYTDASQGGAASGLNDPILLKSGEEGYLSLTAEQRELISLIGETPTALIKSVDNLTTQKENPTIMGEQVSQEDFLALQQELAVEKSLRAISALNLEEPKAEVLAKALSTLTKENLVIVKEALLDLQADINKAADVEVGETDLQKSLSEEAGSEGEGAEMTFAEQVRKSKTDKEAK